MSAIIAIIGRPNVGKSTIFNRLIRKNLAITSEIAGTTRDRISHPLQIEELVVNIVDTGGIEDGKEGNIEANIQAQAKIAIQDADLIVFTVDGSKPLTSDDLLAAEILRKSGKETLLLVNKCDNPKIAENAKHELYSLGMDNMIQVSAAHGQGFAELKTALHQKLEKLGYTQPAKAEEESTLKVSLIGRPNVGKSSLVNSLYGAEKHIVSEVAGTTRDAIDTEIYYQKQKITIVDTAGIRRRGKIERGIEKFSIMRALSSINRSDVCVLLLDFEEGISKQDQHIAEFILEAKKGLIIAVNKSDLMEDSQEDRKIFLRQLHRKFIFAPWAGVLFISAKEKKNIFKIFDMALEIQKERHKRIQTSPFNDFLAKVISKHLPSSRDRHTPKINYATQSDINPPKFTIFMNKPESLHFSYKRYLENEIRKEYGFFGTALDLEFKRKSTTDRKNADKPIKEPRPKKTKSTYKKIVRRGK